MAETKGFTLNTSGYQAISTGKANVTVRLRQRGSVRLYIGTSVPTASTADYFTIDHQNALELGSLVANTDNVYALSNDNPLDIEVIRG